MRAALAAPGGLVALYAGGAPYVARHVVYEILEFVVYEQLRAKVVAHRLEQGGNVEAGSAPGGGLELREAAAMAAAASCLATVASQPLDCIRVAVSISASGGSGGVRTLSSRQALALLLRQRGAAGLFTGLLPRLGSLAPGAVIFFTVYEASRGAAHRLRGERLAAAEAATGLLEIPAAGEPQADVILKPTRESFCPPS